MDSFYYQKRHWRKTPKIKKKRFVTQGKQHHQNHTLDNLPRKWSSLSSFFFLRDFIFSSGPPRRPSPHTGPCSGGRWAPAASVRRASTHLPGAAVERAVPWAWGPPPPVWRGYRKGQITESWQQSIIYLYTYKSLIILIDCFIDWMFAWGRAYIRKFKGKSTCYDS